MYAKIFRQIFDSSIAEDPEVRFTFMDLLILADQNGVVDMTHEAISRRTNRPLETVKRTILVLEGPDPASRTPDDEGRRIKRLDDHREWGWAILNYDRFRLIGNETQRRENTRLRTQRYRLRVRNSSTCDAPVTQCDAAVTPSYASPSPSVSASSYDQEGDCKGGPELPIAELRTRLNLLYGRTADTFTWTYEEEFHLSEVAKRPEVLKELTCLEAYHKRNAQYFPHSLSALLKDWNKTLDHEKHSRISKPVSQRVKGTFSEGADPNRYNHLVNKVRP